MSHGEGGHQLHHGKGCRSAIRLGFPAAVTATQHGGEKQGDEKEDMVEADPDVPDPFPQVVEKGGRRLGIAGFPGHLGPLR